ncbi:hypothetical protein GCM10028864_62360 [Microlunatus parietis]
MPPESPGSAVRGMVPVVKSYPHASQNKASGGFGTEQFGHSTSVAGADVPLAGVPEDAAGWAGAGVASAPPDATIGAPQTSQ